MYNRSLICDFQICFLRKEGHTCQNVGNTIFFFFPFSFSFPRFFDISSFSPSSLRFFDISEDDDGLFFVFSSSIDWRSELMVCSSSSLRLLFVDWWKMRLDGLFFVFSSLRSSSSLRRWFVSEAEFVDWWKIRVIHQGRRSWDSTITRRIKSSSIKLRFFLLFLCSIVFKVHSFLLGPMNIID